MPQSESQLANLIPFKPGQSGNPLGRPSAGATVKEWCNSLMQRNLTKKQLLAITRKDGIPIGESVAALHLLRMAENPDLADYTPFLDAEKDLVQLRKKGL